ncbi:uncharacterized protein [Epargyreus clarus]|uniref:uncharacterized protein isoform X1 n=1 Tax=Epargyreus clarus TaxID=520877 RepID=UPI003C2FF996
MEKRNPKAATLLYRKSNCTLNTRSRTCSSASQFLTKSGKIQLKKKVPKTNYYIGNGKVKRDLSIATDICILRRYYKKKFERFKYSMNSPEVGTIDESNGGNSACGDNISEETNEDTRFNIDVTSLVVENLKHLLNDWIKKYLLNNNETKQKIETVLDSILHKIERQKKSSSCTYTVNIKVDEENYSGSNVARASNRGQSRKQSCQTVPVSGKHLRLISTLSIPRNIKKQVNDVKSHSPKQTTRKIRYKNVFLTVSRSSTFLLNSSSFNLLSISTKSFTKRCATYPGTEIKTSEKKHDMILFPRSSYSETIPDTSCQEDTNLSLQNKVYPNVVEPMQSLVKSIFADDPANVTSTDKNVYESKNDNYTMTDNNSVLKSLTSCTQCHKLHWKKEKVSDEAQYTASPKVEKIVECKRKKYKYSKLKPVPHRRNRKTRPERTTQSLKYIDKKIKIKKSNLSQKENSMFKELQNILSCFSHYTNSKNIKFDVRINVSPMLPDIPETDGTNYKSNINNNEISTDKPITSEEIISKQTALETKDDSVEMQKQIDKSDLSPLSEPKLISLLDGAVSQSKYVISKEASSENTENVAQVQNNKIPPSVEIAKDISELRVIIKDLATTTENFVKEHLEHIKCNKPYVTDVSRKDKNNNIGSIKLDLNTSTVSKATQFSNGKIKSQVVSGFKLKKEPKKKDTQDNNPRLVKKSVSYNVIESESILKVTDMTSTEMNKEKYKDKVLNRSLPKSKSQFDIIGGHNKKKLLAYYCDELVKSRQFVQNRTCPANGRYGCPPHIENESRNLINGNKCNREKEKRHKDITCVGTQHASFDDEDCEICPGYSCSSVYIGIDDHSKKFTVRSRGGVGFWEGLIYCVLLWIPVIVILWLIYVYVIRDIIQPTNPAIGRNLLRSGNSSFFHITLSDLGF